MGSFAWLSTEHLRLAPGFTCKLAAKWAGPDRVVASVGPVAFHLELPPAWKFMMFFMYCNSALLLGLTVLFLLVRMMLLGLLPMKTMSLRLRISLIIALAMVAWNTF